MNVCHKRVLLQTRTYIHTNVSCSHGREGRMLTNAFTVTDVQVVIDTRKNMRKLSIQIELVLIHTQLAKFLLRVTYQRNKLFGKIISRISNYKHVIIITMHDRK